LGRSDNTVVISEDDWLSELFGTQMQNVNDYVQYSARLRTIMKPHVITILQTGLSVVLDFPANTPQMRLWMRGIFEAAECGHQLHYLDRSDEECRKRLQKRNAEGNHPFSASEDQFDLITSYFVPPTIDEGFNTIIHAGKNGPE